MTWYLLTSLILLDVIIYYQHTSWSTFQTFWHHEILGGVMTFFSCCDVFSIPFDIMAYVWRHDVHSILVMYFPYCWDYVMISKSMSWRQQVCLSLRQKYEKYIKKVHHELKKLMESVTKYIKTWWYVNKKYEKYGMVHGKYIIRSTKMSKSTSCYQK